jgi:hypothetical protein
MKKTLLRILSGLLPKAVSEGAPEIHVLLIAHRSGSHVSAHSTEKLAKEALRGYVLDFHADAADPDALTAALLTNDVDQVLDAYFFEHDEESYQIVPCILDKE